MTAAITFLAGFLACAGIVFWFRDCLFCDRNFACYRKPTCGKAWPKWPEKKQKVKMQKSEIRTCLTCGMIFRSRGKCPRCNGTAVYK